MEIESVQEYWQGKNIPQQWYSSKDKLSVQWFNELSRKRFEEYYAYLSIDAEFAHHSGEKVLEVGTGIGTDLVEYAKNGAIASGIDLGSDQVELTKLNFNIRNIDYDTIVQASAEELPFENGSFDLVYSFGVLHHTPDTHKAVSEVHRVLKDDGQAIVMLYARGWKHYLKRCFVHGIILGKIFKYKFNWQKLYNDVSEVHGGSPKTDIYTKSQVKELFKDYSYLEIRKRRVGEFFEYRPYNSKKLPTFFLNLINLLGLESILGENWLIKAYKSPKPETRSVFGVIFKNY
jgi:ubiquinone/menaquinone biosynthesis C-methylase UbiE